MSVVFLSALDQRFRNPAARKVRAMLPSAHFTPALANSHNKLIDVTLWTMESAEDLRARLETVQSGIGDGVDAALRPIHIDTGALKAGLGDFTRQLSLDAEVARLFVRDTMGSMRNAAMRGGEGAFNLGLALGSLWFQQDSLRKSYANMLKAFGDERPEAVVAFMASSVGNLGVGVELVGGSVQMLRPEWKITVHTAVEAKPVGLGSRILQFGGAIAAMATAVEGLQYAMAAGRTHNIGDRKARNAYGMAAGLAAGSALSGIWGALGVTGVLLGPLAAAVVLGLFAFGFAAWAKEQESQPLELWARHSHWGLPEEHRRWKTLDDMDAAIGALNAALLGLTADLGVTGRIEMQGSKVTGWGGTLDYRIVLPGYDANASRYEWVLWAYRPGETSGGIIASGRNDGTNGPLPAPESWKWPGYDAKTTAPIINHDADRRILEISGAITLHAPLDFHALEIELSYWPDKSDESGIARLILKEDKIDGRVRW